MGQDGRHQANHNQPVYSKRIRVNIRFVWPAENGIVNQVQYEAKNRPEWNRHANERQP